MNIISTTALAHTVAALRKREEPSFIALQRERLGEDDRKDFDRLIAMMLTLRQQLTLRRAWEREAERA